MPGSGDLGLNSGLDIYKLHRSTKTFESLPLSEPTAEGWTCPAGLWGRAGEDAGEGCWGQAPERKRRPTGLTLLSHAHLTDEETEAQRSQGLGTRVL